MQKTYSTLIGWKEEVLKLPEKEYLKKGFVYFHICGAYWQYWQYLKKVLSVLSL